MQGMREGIMYQQRVIIVFYNYTEEKDYNIECHRHSSRYFSNNTENE